MSEPGHEEHGVPIECHKHFVGHEPHVMWGTDLDERNLEFLRGIDSGYFTHIANSQAPLLETESMQYAAATIRVAYGQALETLMALLATTLQAPGCALGWMLSYKNNELRMVIEDLLSPAGLSHTTWDLGRHPLIELAGAVLEPAGWASDVLDHRAALLGQAWVRWCHEFLNEDLSAEYNAMKHGTRVQLGGFTIAIGGEGRIFSRRSSATFSASEYCVGSDSRTTTP